MGVAFTFLLCVDPLFEAFKIPIQHAVSHQDQLNVVKVLMRLVLMEFVDKGIPAF
jgi:hypothetical protein